MIHLRALEPEDLQLLYDIENDIQLWDVGCTNVPYSHFLLKQFIAESSGDIFTDKQVRLVAEDDQKNVVGLADLFSFEPKHNRAEAGLVVRSALRNQGIGTEMLQQLLRYAEHIVHLRQVYGYVDVRNYASIQMLKNAGFQQTALVDDWLFDGESYYAAFLMQRIFKK